jgi:hypothetical protein
MPGLRAHRPHKRPDRSAANSVGQSPSQTHRSSPRAWACRARCRFALREGRCRARKAPGYSPARGSRLRDCAHEGPCDARVFGLSEIASNDLPLTSISAAFQASFFAGAEAAVVTQDKETWIRALPIARATTLEPSPTASPALCRSRLYRRAPFVSPGLIARGIRRELFHNTRSGVSPASHVSTVSSSSPGISYPGNDQCTVQIPAAECASAGPPPTRGSLSW